MSTRNLHVASRSIKICNVRSVFPQPACSSPFRSNTSSTLVHNNKPHRTLPKLSAANTPDLDSLLDNLDIPEIEADLATYQIEDGAVFDNQNNTPLTFRNDSKVLEALENNVIITDLTHYGRIRLSGSGARAFLQGQTTNDFTALSPGTGCETVVTTPQARCMDLLTCYIQPSGILCITSPSIKTEILQRFDKHIFPADDVELIDVSSKTVLFAIAGPKSDSILKSLQADSIIGKPWWSHIVMGVAGKPVIIAVGPLLSLPGYLILADEGVAADLWKSVVAQGAEPMGSDAWEVARVINGRPAPRSSSSSGVVVVEKDDDFKSIDAKEFKNNNNNENRELSAEYNPLEAGLYHAVSVEKGCYVGQETLAKVHKLNAVKQELWGLSLQGPVSAGDVVVNVKSGEKVGVVTSAVDVPAGGHRALAYLKCREKGSGKRVQLQDMEVDVGGVKGRVVAIPYATRAFASSSSSDSSSSSVEDEEKAKKAAVDKAEAEAKRQAKLKAMQERLAAWQAEQDGN